MAEEKAPEKRIISFTTKTITSTVYLTGNYKSSSSSKAKELTALVKGLLASGVWPSAKDAAISGVPAGTFIIVDDRNTPEQDFRVEIVPVYRKNKKEL